MGILPFANLYRYLLKMTMNITPERLIKDIQQEFSLFFPFLRIEFLRKPHPFMDSNHKVCTLPNEFIIGHAAKHSVEKNIEITSSMTVRELEESCERNFGVYVKFYRKSGGLWLEVTMTDNWTMKQQNDLGSEISILFDNYNL